MESTDFEKRLKELRRKCDVFSSGLAGQLAAAVEIKSVFEARNQQFKETLENHFMQLIDKILLTKKQLIETQAETVCHKWDERLTQAVNEAHEVKSRLEELLDKYQKIVDDPYYTPSHQQFSNADAELDFTDDDALMINESVNEFDLNNNTTEATTNNSELMRLERSIESLLGQRVLLAEITSEVASHQEAYYNDVLRLQPCCPEIDDGVCLGHLTLGDGQEATLESFARCCPSLDLIDHSKFRFETDLAARFLYTLGEKIKIDFSCPYFGSPERQPAYAKGFHESLRVRALDPFKNEVPVGMNEKIDGRKHMLRLVMEARETPGVYEVSVQYRAVHIPGSPFHIAVVARNDAHGSKSSVVSNEVVVAAAAGLELNSSARSSVSSTNILEPGLLSSSRDAVNFSQNGVVSAGRGRVINKLRMKNLPGGGGGASSEISPPVPRVTSNNIQMYMAPSQKRPKAYDDDSSSHNGTEELEGLSSKLQKLVTVDERIQDGSSSSMREENMASSSDGGAVCVNVVSAHLRKYGYRADRAVDRQIPSVRAEFVMKYAANFKFPIGVRPCAFRDWLIVCDSGSDSVKVLDGNSGRLIAQITSQDRDTYTLKRPSAVLIDNENQSDIYVKDDKEILVFDMNNDFRFVKKFGYGVLHKPYGLAYDNQFNIVVVDANARNPRIHVFDKQSGKLIRSKAYEPVLPPCANPSTLAELYAPGGLVSQTVTPIEKSKIRFIDCQNDALYASDLGRSIIFKTNLDGEIEMAFGHHGKRAGEFNEPSGIHVETDGGAIIVGDSKNDRIQIYGPDGLYKCDVDFKEKIVRPSDIYVDAYGYLYVTCFIQHCIKKYKLISV